MTLPAVQRWRDALWRDRAHAPHEPLSKAGFEEALRVSLAALTDEALSDAVSIEGEPFARAVVVVARSVLTAPIEWCGVLLAHGTAVHLKHPTAAPGLAPFLADTAVACGLPLAASDDRSCLTTAELVVAMGSDASILDIQRQLAPEIRFLGFGHRWSAAWITDVASVDRLAIDLAIHDGRGCMSPSIVGTPLPPAVLGEALRDAMVRIESTCPRGARSDLEAATTRSRAALATVAGECWRGGSATILSLPSALARPDALPRAPTIVHAPDINAFREAIAPWAPALSTLGTDDPLAAWPGVRVCPPGEMQAPPLDRHHDGVPWLREMVRRASND